MILRNPECIDPIVDSVVGKSLSNFVETHRLYPLRDEVLAKIPDGEGTIIFCDPADISNLDLLRHRMRNGDVVLSGTMALRANVPPDILAARPRSILRVASPDWSFHSDESDLVSFIRRLSCRGVRVLLFHNYTKRLRRFVRDNDLDGRLVGVISNRSISLSGDDLDV